MSAKLFDFPALICCLVLLSLTATAANDQLTKISTGTPEKIDFHRQFNTIESISGNFLVSEGTTRSEKAYSFINSRLNAFKIKNPPQELELLSEKTDQLGLTHLRFQQKYQGLKVWGCQTIVHFKDEQTIYRVGGQIVPSPELDKSPSIESGTAINYAVEELKGELDKFQSGADSELLIYPNDGSPRLAYMITITSPDNGAVRWRVFIDAQTGEILHKFNDIHYDGPDIGTGPDTRDTMRTFNIYETAGEFQMIDVTHNTVITTYQNYYNGGPISTDPDSDKVWDDNVGHKAEVAGHYYTQLTYEYFLSTFGRDSYDGAGSDILVNIHDPVYVNNAYWNGQAINFADGDGVNWLPFSGSKDVVAHELAHGVTQYSAGLIYQFQSGALNESFSDVFGAMVDRDDWLLGEEISLTGNFIRSMADPNLKGHPKHMSDYRYLPISTDNGGVHINSGIPNYIYYLTSLQISKDIAEQIWYRTLTTYLTPGSGFYFWAGMTIQSAIDLYGPSSVEVDAVAVALAMAGLGTAYALPEAVETGGLIGEINNDEIWIYNPWTSTGSQTVTVTPPATPGLSITGGPYYQEIIPDGDSSQFIVTFDASGLDECNLGHYADTVEFEVVSAYGTTNIRLPMTITVGRTARAIESDIYSTSCLSAQTYNTTFMDYFSRDGNDVLYQSSLMVGLNDGGTPKVYRHIFGVQSISPIDSFRYYTDSLSFGFSTEDARVQGEVAYYQDMINPTNCDFIVADYILYNPCDTALNILAGLVADFDIDNSGANFADYDESNKMIYMTNSGDTRAVGMALLSGTPRNLRAIHNPTWVNGGVFTDNVAYTELNSSINFSVAFSDDWTALLTFGDGQIGPGDTLKYSVALLYSNSGSTGLADIYNRALEWLGISDYVCGDVNTDETVNILDITFLINCLYKGGPCPDPEDPGDVNNDGNVNILDITYLIAFLYKDGPDPVCR